MGTSGETAKPEAIRVTETPTTKHRAHSASQPTGGAERRSPAARVPTPEDQPPPREERLVSEPEPEPDPTPRVPVIEDRPDTEVETPPPPGGDTDPPSNPQPIPGSATPSNPADQPPGEVASDGSQ